MCLYICSRFSVPPMERQDWQEAPGLTQVDLNSLFGFSFSYFSVFRRLFDKSVVCVIKHACGREQATGVTPVAWPRRRLSLARASISALGAVRRRVSLAQW